MLKPDLLYERDLLQRVALGDEKAFRSVFYYFKDGFYAAALKMTHSADIAEEIVQDVFVTLWMRRSALANVENPTSYLFTIVYNRIRRHFKTLAIEERVKQSFASRQPDNECLTMNHLIEKENQRLLQDVLCQLSPQQFQVYQLSKLEGLSRNEIAAQLGISPNTVKNHLLKAVKHIRSHFQKSLKAFLCFFL